MINENMGCCGMRELDGLRDNGERTVKQFCDELFDCYNDESLSISDINFIHVVFSDTKRSSKGSSLASYIKRKGLGSVVATSYKKNPNSGNSLKAWLWTINRYALVEWYKQNK